MNAGFGGGSGGVYHSIYDSVRLVHEVLGSRTFRTVNVLTQVMSSALLLRWPTLQCCLSNSANVRRPFAVILADLSSA